MKNDAKSLLLVCGTTIQKINR